ncbi:MAG TPA: PPOX class F420-dependent oxidoreductase [Terriglobales bacterium]|nr:PPOX class F420-dependent oxidoreductase [Terriglobales bacterium]
MPIPPEIRGRKYVSLTTFRKNGAAVRTPVWFGEDDETLYVKTPGDSGKCKRIRNNPHVLVAPCTVTGKITGLEFAARARILRPEDWPRPRRAVEKKYWLTRISFWNKKNVYIEITGFAPHP